MSTGKTQSKLLYIVIIAILVLALVITGFFAIKFRVDLSNAWIDLEEAENIIVAQTEEVAHLNDVVAQFEDELAEAEKTIADRDAKIADQLETIDTKTAQVGQLRIERGNLEYDLTVAESKLSHYLCENQITNMDYKDILTSSDRLAAFMSGLPNVKRTSYTFRNTIWNNAMSKLHGINFVSQSDGNVYSMQFLVYYDEFNFEEGTFSVDMQCWVDSPFD